MVRLAIAVFMSAAIVGAAAPSTSQTPRAWPPRDDAARLPGLAQMRDELRKAFAAADWATVRKYTHPDIVLGALGETGRGQFIARLKSKKPLGPALSRILSRGGALTGRDRFVAPYTALVRTGSLPRDQAGVLTGGNVPVLSEPREDAATVAKRSYTVVSVPEWAIGYEGDTSPEGWLKIATGGARGYVRAGQVAPVVSFVLRFRRINGIWWLTRLDTSFE